MQCSGNYNVYSTQIGDSSLERTQPYIYIYIYIYILNWDKHKIKVLCVDNLNRMLWLEMNADQWISVDIGVGGDMIADMGTLIVIL